MRFLKASIVLCWPACVSFVAWSSSSPGCAANWMDRALQIFCTYTLMRRPPNELHELTWRDAESWKLMSDYDQILSLAAEDLACYAVAMWRGFELAAHHQLIVDKLEAVERGELTQSMIWTPPRHGKSLLISQLLPAWYLGRHPDRQIASVTYGQALSDGF